MTTSDKKLLRAESLVRREAIAPEVAKAASMKLAEQLVKIIPPSAEIVAGYRAVRGEIDVAEALAQLSERGHELCLPVIAAPRTPLKFRRWRIGHALELGQFGIEIPPATEPELIPDIVLVPLAAFDKKLHRLGYGAGFYDATIRALRAAKKVQIIGVAFASQQVDGIPAEPHDEKLDAVVTENGVI